MATDAVPRSVALQQPLAPDYSDVPPLLVPGALSVDPSAESLPIAPLPAVEVTAVPTVGRLLRTARTALGVLAHPYPRRAPKPPLAREEHLALAQNETARLERERQAYRTSALGAPMR